MIINDDYMMMVRQHRPTRYDNCNIENNNSNGCVIIMYQYWWYVASNGQNKRHVTATAAAWLGHVGSLTTGLMVVLKWFECLLLRHD